MTTYRETLSALSEILCLCQNNWCMRAHKYTHTWHTHRHTHDTHTQAHTWNTHSGTHMAYTQVHIWHTHTGTHRQTHKHTQRSRLLGCCWLSLQGSKEVLKESKHLCALLSGTSRSTVRNIQCISTKFPS